MFRRSVLTSALLAFILTTAAIADSGKIAQIRIKPTGMKQHMQIAQMGLDARRGPAGEIDVFASPSDLEELRGRGFTYEVVHSDVQTFYAERATDALSFGGFLGFFDIEVWLDEHSLTYPSLMTEKFSIGTSVQGTPQWVVKISDNPNIDEDEPEVFYISLIHAREPIGPATLMNFMDYLLSNYGTDPEVTDIVDNRELFFLLVQNPDGYIYNELIAPDGGGMWRKNMRNNGDGTFGVDLNRNYGYMWGFDNYGSTPYTWDDLYRGPAPFSEPETYNVRDFVESRNFQIIHNLHSYSNLELWAPSYRRMFSPREEFYVNLGDSMCQYNGYDPGIGWTLYPTNGDADDWAWLDTLSKPPIVSLTAEIGNSADGFWPDPDRIPILIAENLWPNLYLAKIADSPFRIGPPLIPEVTVPEISLPDFNVSWAVHDTANPAVAYRLLECQDPQQFVDDAESDYGYFENFQMIRTSYRSHSGTYSWCAYSQEDIYQWMYSSHPYLVKSSDSLRFWIWYNVDENWEYFYAQVSTDGGYTYENLAGNLTTNYDPNNMNIGEGITGTSGGWVQAKYDLSAYEGLQVIFRLYYYGYGYPQEHGVFIDDIENVELFLSQTEIDPAVADTVYAFSEKPEGDYWYRVYATDAEGQTSRPSFYAHTTVIALECCNRMGDFDGNEQMDPMDAVAFVDWLWNDGPGPNCEEELEVNGDNQVDPMDLVYIIEYLWDYGPEFVSCHLF